MALKGRVSTILTGGLILVRVELLSEAVVPVVESGLRWMLESALESGLESALLIEAHTTTKRHALGVLESGC